MSQKVMGIFFDFIGAMLGAILIAILGPFISPCGSHLGTSKIGNLFCTQKNMNKLGEKTRKKYRPNYLGFYRVPRWLHHGYIKGPKMAPKMVPKMAPLKIPLLNVYIWEIWGSRFFLFFSIFFETGVFGARTARAWIGSGASSGGYPRGSFPNGEGRGQVIIHKGPYGL